MYENHIKKSWNSITSGRLERPKEKTSSKEDNLVTSFALILSLNTNQISFYSCFMKLDIYIERGREKKWEMMIFKIN